MNFLFIDSECATCFKDEMRVCSFGYVLTDEKLNIIKKEDILINPIEFDPKILENVIAYSKDELLSKKEFDKLYPYIRNLLEDKNNIVIGQSVLNDVKFINDTTKRYNLSPLEYAVYDIAEIYQNVFNNSDYLSLEKEGEELSCITMQGDKHTSLNDAILTYECFKKLSETLSLNPLTMLKKYRGYVGLSKNYETLSLLDFKHASNNMSKKSVNRSRFQIFLKNYKRQSFDNNTLDKIRINIGYDYEKSNYREMLYIVSLIKNLGGRYVMSPLSADYYVSVEGEHNSERLNSKKFKKVLSLNELFELINFKKSEVYNFYDFILKYDLLLTSEEKGKKHFVKEYGVNRLKNNKFIK